MGKIWHGFVQFNMADASVFRKVEFEISEEQYAAIQEAIRTEKKLISLDIYEDLLAAAKDAFDVDDFLGIGEEPEAPNPDDYENEDEYEDAFEEYEDALAEYDDMMEDMESDADDFYLEDISIEDPTLLKKLIRSFFEKKISSENLTRCDRAEDGCYKYDIDFEENSCRCVRYGGTLIFNKNGELIDLQGLYAAGVEREGLRSPSFGECMPDFEFLKNEIADTFEWKEM